MRLFSVILHYWVVFSMVFASALPTLSHAASPWLRSHTASQDWVQICRGSDFVWVRLDNKAAQAFAIGSAPVADGLGDNTQHPPQSQALNNYHALEHCPYCQLQSQWQSILPNALDLGVYAVTKLLALVTGAPQPARPLSHQSYPCPLSRAPPALY